MPSRPTAAPACPGTSPSPRSTPRHACCGSPTAPTRSTASAWPAASCARTCPAEQRRRAPPPAATPPRAPSAERNDPMAAPELVHYEVAGGVATVTLDSPSNRNALSSQLLGQLVAALERAGADAAARVVVLTGADPAFCSGADLAEQLAGSRQRAGTRDQAGHSTG